MATQLNIFIAFGDERFEEAARLLYTVWPYLPACFVADLVVFHLWVWRQRRKTSKYLEELRRSIPGTPS